MSLQPEVHEDKKSGDEDKVDDQTDRRNEFFGLSHAEEEIRKQTLVHGKFWARHLPRFREESQSRHARLIVE